MALAMEMGKQPMAEVRQGASEQEKARVWEKHAEATVQAKKRK